MKPRNFPLAKLRRRGVAKLVGDKVAMTEAELTAIHTPKDITFRVGRARRTPEGIPA